MSAAGTRCRGTAHGRRRRALVAHSFPRTRLAGVPSGVAPDDPHPRRPAVPARSVIVSRRGARDPRRARRRRPSIVMPPSSAIVGAFVARRSVGRLVSGVGCSSWRRPCAPGDRLRVVRPGARRVVDAELVRIGPLTTTLCTDPGLLEVPQPENSVRSAGSAPALIRQKQSSRLDSSRRAVPGSLPWPTSTGVLADLGAECDDLDALVAPLTATQLAHPRRPRAGLDDRRTRSGTSPGPTTSPRSPRPTPTAFSAAAAASAAAELDTYVDRAAAERAATPPPSLLDALARRRGALADALRAVPAGTKLPWFGPPMSATSMATARLMETWAHGQDVADALGVAAPADRPRSGTSRTSACAPATSPTCVRDSHAAGRAVPRRAQPPRPASCGRGARTTLPSRSPARRSTSACSSPSDDTATTSRSSPSAPTPTSGSTSRRRSPGRRATGRKPGQFG